MGAMNQTSDVSWCQKHRRKKYTTGDGDTETHCNVCDFLERLA